MSPRQLVDMTGSPATGFLNSPGDPLNLSTGRIGSYTVTRHVATTGRDLFSGAGASGGSVEIPITGRRLNGVEHQNIDTQSPGSDDLSPSAIQPPWRADRHQSIEDSISQVLDGLERMVHIQSVRHYETQLEQTRFRQELLQEHRRFRQELLQEHRRFREDILQEQMQFRQQLTQQLNREIDSNPSQFIDTQRSLIAATPPANRGDRTTLESTASARREGRELPSSSGLAETALPSENNRESNEIGQYWSCKHYKRRCVVKFNCSDEFFPCHQCYNEKAERDGLEQSKITSRDAVKIRCNVCFTVQDVSQNCVACDVRFAEYFCRKCNHLISREKDPYHCDPCGVCRMGQSNSFHCNDCNICWHVKLKNTHHCNPEATHVECAICFEDTFSGCRELPCFHRVHDGCFHKMRRHGITTCPMCRYPLDGERKNQRPIAPSPDH